MEYLVEIDTAVMDRLVAERHGGAAITFEQVDEAMQDHGIVFAQYQQDEDGEIDSALSHPRIA